MPFKQDKPRRHGQYRLAQDTIHAVANCDFVTRLTELSSDLHVTRALLASAAVLAFEALDREAQVSLVLANPLPRKADYWPMHWYVMPPIAALVRAWQFPCFTQAQTVRAAMLAFMEIPGVEQESWIHEIHVFLGDPRQSPCHPLTPSPGHVAPARPRQLAPSTVYRLPSTPKQPVHK